MVYIETLIKCKNCEYEIKLYNGQCFDIKDMTMDFEYSCIKCNIDCCINCTLKDIEENIYCENCYWKYVQKGLTNPYKCENCNITDYKEEYNDIKYRENHNMVLCNDCNFHLFQR